MSARWPGKITVWRSDLPRKPDASSSLKSDFSGPAELCLCVHLLAAGPATLGDDGHHLRNRGSDDPRAAGCAPARLRRTLRDPGAVDPAPAWAARLPGVPARPAGAGPLENL